MTFDSKHPNVKLLQEAENGWLIRSIAWGECLVCGDPTLWVDIGSEEFCCSEECWAQIWDGFENPAPAFLRTAPIQGESTLLDFA